MDSAQFTTLPCSSSIRVIWETSVDSTQKYLIKYRESGTTGDFYNFTGGKNDVEIVELKSNTKYDISIYFIDSYGDNHSIFKTACTTKFSRGANFLKDNSIAVADSTGDPTVYHLRAIHTDKIFVPFVTRNLPNNRSDRNNEYCDYIRVCDMIAEYKQSITTSEEKTLLVLGATGTGKSTFIESLMNYIADVPYLEDHRFSIICKTEEERQRVHRQHISQTTSVTLYRIPKIKSLKVPYKVNIIDTPGFHDTRNTEGPPDTPRDFDKRIEMQIKHLLEKTVDHLNAILLVVPMAESRLTNAQKEIFSSIVNLFGNDVKQNIFIAMTKDDGGKAFCLSLIEATGIPYKESFRFNNSNVFTKASTKMDQSIWMERKKTFTRLFAAIDEAPKTSVKSTVDVMNARISLQLQLRGLKNKLSELTQAVANANINLDSVDKDPKLMTIKYALPTPVYERQYTGKSSMNCTMCHQTCHENCLVPANILNWTCESIKDKTCLVCDNNCDVSKHVREKYIYKLQYKAKTFNNISFLKDFIQQKRESFAQFQSIIDKIEMLIKELKKKALKPDVLSTEAYIQELIERERNENQRDSTSRINVLEKLILHLKKRESIWKLKIDFAKS